MKTFDFKKKFNRKKTKKETLKNSCFPQMNHTGTVQTELLCITCQGAPVLWIRIRKDPKLFAYPGQDSKLDENINKNPSKKD
jgi:hypothetical protein